MVGLVMIGCAHVRAALKPFVCKLPCVYVLSLGRAASLAKQWKWPEDWPDPSSLGPRAAVAKYGHTCDLRRRLAEHERTYGPFDVACVAAVDPAFSAEAELAMEAMLERRGLLLPGRRELTLLPGSPAEMRQVSREIRLIADFYSGRCMRLRDCQKAV